MRILRSQMLVPGDRHDTGRDRVDGCDIFFCTSAGARIGLGRPGRRPLPPLAGDCELYLSLVDLDGTIEAPRLVIEPGDGSRAGLAEGGSLTRIGAGTYKAIVRLPGPDTRIWLAPAAAPARFLLGPCWIQKRTGALPARRGVGHLGYVVARQLLNWLPVGDPARRRLRARLLSGLFPRQLRVSHIEREFAPRRPSPGPARRARPTAFAALYRHQMAIAAGDRDRDYGAPMRRAVDAARCDVRVVAFYVPCADPAAWTRVVTALPQFKGHYQPRLPGELGCYDTRLPSTLKRQAALARRHGISAFCFDLVDGSTWPADHPVQHLLTHPDIEIGFCLRLGHGAADPAEPVLRCLRDARYLRIDGRPVLLVDRAAARPEAAARWRAAAIAAGCPGLYLVACGAEPDRDRPGPGFDAFYDAPLRDVQPVGPRPPLVLYNPAFAGTVQRYPDLVRVPARACPEAVPVMPGVMPSWDSTARDGARGHVVHGASPELFRRWLSEAFGWVSQRNRPAERLVFVHAWNAWSEGAYLEPDSRLGHANLAAIANVTAAFVRRDPAAADIVTARRRGWARAADAVVVLHLFYPELLGEFADLLGRLTGVDVFVSLPDTWTAAEIRPVADALPAARLFRLPNRGRDILPFLTVLPEVVAAGYPLLCKVHAKLSPQLAGGDAWRRSLTDGLLRPASVAAAFRRFAAEPGLGMLVPGRWLCPLDAAPGLMANNLRHGTRLFAALGHDGRLSVPFPKGSMFWARTAALSPLLALNLAAADFEEELGQIDGTLAHAVERCFGLVVAKAGATVATMESPTD